MARTTSRPTPTAICTLQPLGRHCPVYGETMWAAYHNYRTSTTLDNVVHLTLQIRRCLNRSCPQFRRPYRPEAEGRLALPRHEFGLDVIACVGTLRSCRTANCPSAVPSRRCSPRCHTNSVTSIISARQRSPFMTPTAMPRKNSKSGFVGYAPSNGASKAGGTLKPKSCGATVRPCGVPSRMMAAHPWKPRGSNSTTVSPRLLPVSSGAKKGALPQELSRLKCLLARGLMDTADLWPDVRVGYRWVYQAAHILSNQDQHQALTVQRRLGGLLGAMTRHQAAAGTLAPALGYFRKVTRSYWPGLFPCYTVPDLPRTNNDLEQFFGAYRYHDRRTTGRKVASLAWS